MSFELRECSPSDVDAVLALWRAADAVPRPTDRADALLKRIAHDDGLFLLAVSEGEVVGSLIGAWDGWRGSLYRLATHPAWRRQGVATALVREVEARMRSLGAERVPIRVFHGEPGAIEFWTALGYEPEPDESIYARNL